MRHVMLRIRASKLPKDVVLEMQEVITKSKSEEFSSLGVTKSLIPYLENLTEEYKMLTEADTLEKRVFTMRS